MQEFSKETIEIDGKEYTLFVNRKGLISWEKITKISSRANKLQDKYKDTLNEINNETPVEVNDKDNPFDYAKDEEFEEMLKDEEELKDIYIKFYWIALYENHKLSLSETTELFEKAEKEYGLEQLMLLANQMIEDSNKNKYGNAELKKLTALHQIK